VAGLGLSVLSWAGLVVLLLQGRRARTIVSGELSRLAVDLAPHRLPWWRLLLPFPVRLAHSRRIKDVPYRRVAGRELRLDVYLPEAPGHRRPAIVQVHGGAWVIGDKREQGVPLLVHLSDHGFVGFNVNYRLSPGATFPDHLIDLKAAIAWIRAHADDYGVDPDFIAVTGGSAGGHLAAMLALTANRPEYQPGFSHADTSVQACVPLYGVYDLVNRLGTHGPRYVDGFIGPVVLKAFFGEEPHKFHDASPVDRVHDAAPPFFVIHGDRDTMSPLEDARLFVDRLRPVSRQPVLFAEIPGAQHAFDVFVSPRSAPVIEAVTAFLVETHRRHLQAHVASSEEAEARATA
jgi:acetyl esterase/lipase